MKVVFLVTLCVCVDLRRGWIIWEYFALLHVDGTEALRNYIIPMRTLVLLTITRIALERQCPRMLESWRRIGAVSGDVGGG